SRCAISGTETRTEESSTTAARARLPGGPPSRSWTSSERSASVGCLTKRLGTSAATHHLSLEDDWEIVARNFPVDPESPSGAGRYGTRPVLSRTTGSLEPLEWGSLAGGEGISVDVQDHRDDRVVAAGRDQV